MMLRKRKEKKILHESIVGVQDFSAIPATNFGFISAYNHGLDSGKEIYSTYDVFRAHFHKIILNYIIFYYFVLFWLHQFVVNSVELLRIFNFDFNYRVHDYKREPEQRFFQSFITQIVYYWELVWSIPTLLWKIYYPRSGTPSGLKNCMLHIPQTNTPKSIGLILHSDYVMIAPPPELPKPFLDSDRNIKIPDKKKVQYSLAIRNEYFTQVRSHDDAERTRLLREIGKFITWCCLVPSILNITIYEKTAKCWQTGETSFLDTIKNAILVELVSIKNTFDAQELKKFKETLPKIVLVNTITKMKYVVYEEDYVPNQPNNEVTVADIISGYENQRTLFVNLCDIRLRDVKFNIISNKADLKPEDEIFGTEFPSTPDLLIGANHDRGMKNQLEGFACIDEEYKHQNSSTIVYFSHIKFGFNFFSRSLYHYALEYPFNLPADETTQVTG
ncbi:uncharacterized protein KGF55_001915 [Candida pseudojiufengensis]|uniref:uncharacterized protein n=1 Tax=Candida pseudojiufengensis TaxID=497109 RepID=UPI0022258B6B|nr:uncharacterized protein KGF55_001915 [Candida pseudojiufengensis]KAI5964845.1 hypothetical protein KGF55_001915 [Candida pseudojiufengensis]